MVWLKCVLLIRYAPYSSVEVKDYGHTRDIHTKPCTHAWHVHGSRLPRVAGTEKLPPDVEGDGVGTNLQDHGTRTQSRKRHVLKSRRRRRTVPASVRNLQSRRETTLRKMPTRNQLFDRFIMLLHSVPCERLGQMPLRPSSRNVKPLLQATLHLNRNLLKF